MILLITSSARAQECAAAIAASTGERTEFVPTLKRALPLLRGEQFSAVVLDQCLMEADPATTDLVLSQLGTAIPVCVNLAISGIERVLRDVRTALERRAQELIIARREAASVLRSQLTEPLTGILLSSELALAVPALPAAAQEKLKSVYQLATLMRQRLETVS